MKAKLLKLRIFFFVTLIIFLNGLVLAQINPGWVAMADLPPEAQQTMVLIKQGGPFPYPKDGVVFGNYEQLLPKQGRGYYHEYTVKTPDQKNRGVQRIVVGGNAGAAKQYYYTGDHYASFKRIKE